MPAARTRMAAVSTVGMLAVGSLTATTAATADASAATTVHVSITARHVIHMPTHLQPGVVKLKISSAKPGSLQVVRPKPGYTKRDLAHDVRLGLSGNRVDVKVLKRFERNLTLLGGISSKPGQPGVMWTRLRSGTYWVLDTTPDVPRPSKTLTVHVGGASVGGMLPMGPTIRAVDEARWAPRPVSIRHSGVLRFRNKSTDNHFITTGKLLPGKTLADFKAWVAKAKSGQNARPPFDQKAPSIDSGVVSPGHAMALRYSVPPGRYVLMCFWPDAEHGGTPHALMGMYRALTVT
jgi:hypothetical protein